jgi:hypothetical protein
MRNLKIDKKGRKAEIELKKDLYPESAVTKAADDFKKILDVSVKKTGENLKVTLNLKAKSPEIEEVAYNFINYLLAEVKNGMIKVL